MNGFFIMITGIATLGCAYWLISAWLILRTIRSVPPLPPQAAPLGHTDRPRSGRPKVSVIIPARNEADSIEAAVRSRLEDDSDDIEYILINDRSTDATGEIIDQIAQEDSRVLALHINELPDAWLGKIHAMQRGVNVARGGWLLLTDADVHITPSTLGRAIDFAQANDLDMLALLPAIWPHATILDAVLSSFARLFLPLARLWAVQNPRSSAAMGVGAFNLLRSERLKRTPGLEWLRMEIVDDVGLAKMIKQHGGRCGIATAFDSIGLYWHRSLAQLARGMEKSVTLSGYRALLGVPLALLAGVIWLSPFFAITQIAQTWLWMLGAASDSGSECDRFTST